MQAGGNDSGGLRVQIVGAVGQPQISTLPECADQLLDVEGIALRPLGHGPVQGLAGRVGIQLGVHKRPDVRRPQ